MSADYSYEASVKSDASDELINTHLLRPVAGVLVRLLYPTPVTPNHVTLGAILCGCVAAGLYVPGEPSLTAAAGLCLTLKDLLDSADGQLARAKGMFSRAGRFLDSIGDITVDFLVFSAIAAAMMRGGAGIVKVAACAAAFLCISLRVSCHVYYQTSFLHLKHTYTGNRTSEEVREEDMDADALTRTLQKIFIVLYGWQDDLMARIDRWCRKGLTGGRESDELWFGDQAGVRLTGFLGLGTELFLLMVFSVLNRLDLYLALNIAGMNALWGIALLYRRVVLRRRIARGR